MTNVSNTTRIRANLSRLSSNRRRLASARVAVFTRFVLLRRSAPISAAASRRKRAERQAEAERVDVDRVFVAAQQELVLALPRSLPAPLRQSVAVAADKAIESLPLVLAKHLGDRRTDGALESWFKARTKARQRMHADIMALRAQLREPTGALQLLSSSKSSDLSLKSKETLFEYLTRLEIRVPTKYLHSINKALPTGRGPAEAEDERDAEAASVAALLPVKTGKGNQYTSQFASSLVQWKTANSLTYDKASSAVHHSVPCSSHACLAGEDADAACSAARSRRACRERRCRSDDLEEV